MKGRVIGFKQMWDFGWQGCVMLPWLLNMYMDTVVREVNARVQDNGLPLVDDNGGEWIMNQLLRKACRNW